MTLKCVLTIYLFRVIIIGLLGGARDLHLRVHGVGCL